MWKEFKDFAMKGNVIDMTIGVIIGGAFGKIVTSLVSDIIMPLLGLLTDGINFSSLKIVLSPAELDASGAVIRPENVLNYGLFIDTILNFLIIAFCIFIIIRTINQAKEKLTKHTEKTEEVTEEAVTTESLLTEIRDLLKEKEK